MPRGAALDELLGEEAGQQRAVHLDHVGQVRVDRLAQGVLDDRVAASEGEDPKAAQEVEVPRARLVVEVATLAALVEAVHAEGLEDLGELGVDVFGVQLEVLAVTTLHQFREVKGHDPPLRSIQIYAMVTILATPLSTVGEATAVWS